MKVNTKRILFLNIVIAFAIFTSCEKNDTTSSVPAIEDDWDAWVVASDICSALDNFILYSRTQNKTWNNETENGTQGTITIDGNYEYIKYTYSYSYPDIYYGFNNVSMNFDKFSMSSDEDALIITGSATMNGSIHEKSGSTSSSFSGGWLLTCSLVIEGKYSDEISLSITFTEDSMQRDYSGTLTTASGKSFSIKSRI